MNTPRTSVSKIETLLHKTEHFGMVSAPSAPRRCSLILLQLQRECCEDVSGEQLVWSGFFLTTTGPAVVSIVLVKERSHAERDWIWVA